MYLTRAGYFQYVKETFFEFKIEVKESLIPNAGFGAFLTFLGGRKLSKKSKKKAKEWLQNIDICIPETMNSLHGTIGTH